MATRQLQLTSDSHSPQIVTASSISSNTDVGSSTSTSIVSTPQQLFASTNGKRHTLMPKYLKYPQWSVQRNGISSYLALCRHWDDWKSEYGLMGCWQIPYFDFAFSIALQAKASFSVVHWPKICCTLSVRNIVPWNSKFIKACSTGNLPYVRELALAGHGGPTDIDNYGWPALHVRPRHARFHIRADLHLACSEERFS